MEPADAVLVARVLERDDRHAFATLVRRHQSAVRSLLRRLTAGDHAWADDLAQETFLSAYRSLASFRGQARLSSWLYRIAYNAWVDAARARKRPAELADDRLTSTSGADRADARMDLERAIAGLRPDERAALALTYAEDATHEEAAAILGWPLGTLKSNVSSAKRKLRTALVAGAGSVQSETAAAGGTRSVEP